MNTQPETRTRTTAPRFAWMAITLVLTSLTGGTSSPLWRLFGRRAKHTTPTRAALPAAPALALS